MPWSALRSRGPHVCSVRQCRGATLLIGAPLLHSSLGGVGCGVGCGYGVGCGVGCCGGGSGLAAAGGSGAPTKVQGRLRSAAVAQQPLAPDQPPAPDPDTAACVRRRRRRRQQQEQQQQQQQEQQRQQGERRGSCLRPLSTPLSRGGAARGWCGRHKRFCRLHVAYLVVIHEVLEGPAHPGIPRSHRSCPAATPPGTQHGLQLLHVHARKKILQPRDRPGLVG